MHIRDLNVSCASSIRIEEFMCSDSSGSFVFRNESLPTEGAMPHLPTVLDSNQERALHLAKDEERKHGTRSTIQCFAQVELPRRRSDDASRDAGLFAFRFRFAEDCNPTSTDRPQSAPSQKACVVILQLFRESPGKCLWMMANATSGLPDVRKVRTRTSSPVWRLCLDRNLPWNARRPSWWRFPARPRIPRRRGTSLDSRSRA